MAPVKSGSSVGWQVLEEAYQRQLVPLLAREGNANNPTLPTTLYVGLSGGLDSMVLLHLTRQWITERRTSSGTANPNSTPRIIALHANHGLQAQAAGWLEFCKLQCAALGVELVSQHLGLEPAERSEAAARAARYRFFANQLARAPGVLLLAHHANDQAETLVLRLAQGRDAVGMPAVRRLSAGWLLRPLLELSRDDLLNYARQEALDWQEDPSNDDTGYDRNLVRHKVIPALAERWPQFSQRAAGWATRQRHQADLLQQLVSGLNRLPVQDLLQASGPHLLAAWLYSRVAQMPTQRALGEFCRQLRAAPDKTPRLALPGGELRRYRQEVYFLPQQPALALPCHVQLAVPGVLTLPHGELLVEGAVAQLDVRFAAQLAGSLFAPPVRRARWQQAQVPPWLRPNYPQLFQGEQRLGLPQMASQPARLWSADSEVGSLPRLVGATAASPWRALWRPSAGIH